MTTQRKSRATREAPVPAGGSRATRAKDGAGKPELLAHYRMMQLIRLFEEKSGEMYMLGKIRGFLHLYIGEEAVAVGATASMQPQDYIVTHYRDPRARPGPGNEPPRYHGGVIWPGYRHQPWPGRLHAPGGRLSQFLRRLCHRGRADPHVPGARHGISAVEGGPGGLRFLGRRGRQPGDLPRGHEHGLAVEIACSLLCGEQPVRHGQPYRPDPRRGT